MKSTRTKRSPLSQLTLTACRGGLIASLTRPPVLRLPNHPPDGRDRRWRSASNPKGRLNAGAATDQKASPRRWRSCQPSEARMTDEGAKAIAASVSGNGLSSFSCLKKSPCAEASLIHRSFLAVPGGRAPVPAEQIAARSPPSQPSTGWSGSPMATGFEPLDKGSQPPVHRLSNDSQDRLNCFATGAEPPARHIRGNS